MRKNITEFERAVLSAALIADGGGQPVTLSVLARMLGDDLADVRQAVEVLRGHGLLGGTKAAVQIRWSRLSLVDVAASVGVDPRSAEMLWPMLEMLDAASGCQCPACLGVDPSECPL
jgi:hypothetical protein